MAIKLIKCTCVHADQDKMYGAGNRIANEMRSGQLRCVVCNTMHGAQGATQSDKVSAKVAAKETVKGSKDKKVEKPKKKRSLKGGKR